MSTQLRVAVVTISSSCAAGQASDKSGPVLCEMVREKNWLIVETAVINDDRIKIEATLRHLVSNGIDIILTTGGTGISPDDQTPEATKAVIDRELPGLVSAMFNASYQETPFAMLSRSVAGVTGSSVIVNMPGSVRAVKTCFATICGVLEHAVSLVKGKRDEVQKVHSEMGGAHHHRHHLAHHQDFAAHSHSHGHSHSHTHHQRHLCGGNKTDDSGRRIHGEDRPRQSPFPTVSVDKALETILAHCGEFESLEVEEVQLPCCHAFGATVIDNAKSSVYNRVLAKDLYSLCPVPAFRASIKDGYAVRSADGAGKRVVIGRSDAGICYNGSSLQPGYAVAINTGAKVPDSADAVIQIEDTRFVSGKSFDDNLKVPVLETIELLSVPIAQQDIRPIGCDLQIGEKLISVGDRLTPAAVALLISGGYSKVPVFKLPTIAVLSTGSELVSNEIPSEGSSFVRDSNRPMLLELLASHGFSSHDCGIAKDTQEDHHSKLKDALSIPGIHVLITTGGVSMGDCDYVKDVLVRDFEAKIHFGRVFVKPGKPTVFATIKKENRSVLIFSLPGNPVSALVTAHLFLLPAIHRLSGSSSKDPVPTMYAKLEHDFRLDPRPEYHRVFLRSDPASGCLIASSTNQKQASSRIASAATSTSSMLMLGILALPPSSNEKEIISAGSVLPVHPLMPF